GAGLAGDIHTRRVAQECKNTRSIIKSVERRSEGRVVGGYQGKVIYQEILRCLSVSCQEKIYLEAVSIDDTTRKSCRGTIVNNGNGIFGVSSFKCVNQICYRTIIRRNPVEIRGYREVYIGLSVRRRAFVIGASDE